MISDSKGTSSIERAIPIKIILIKGETQEFSSIGRILKGPKRAIPRQADNIDIKVKKCIFIYSLY
jgi:hypothetical protein